MPPKRGASENTTATKRTKQLSSSSPFAPLRQSVDETTGTICVTRGRGRGRGKRRRGVGRPKSINIQQQTNFSNDDTLTASEEMNSNSVSPSVSS